MKWIGRGLLALIVVVLLYQLWLFRACLVVG